MPVQRHTLIKALLRAVLKLLGKGEGKVGAVFQHSPATCHSVVLHLRQGAPQIPLWLFATSEPLPDTAALCERVVVRRNAMALVLRAECDLWRRTVAISAGAWTGERGGTLLKLAPLLIPPFRAVFANGNNDFLSATPPNILRHCRRRMRNATVRLLNAFDRRLFPRLHGAERPPLSFVPASGSGVARYAGGLEWNGPDLERFALASSARWIVWSLGASDPAGDMLPLFEDERTFAVSRQDSHRQWQLRLFATAALRALQPGEASRVLAPLSGTIAIDRSKLLALGVPRCRMAWTAWLLLFWKAAAAGWRSYSMGRPEPVSQEPEYFLAERVFLFRVVTRQDLRRLGPVEPYLSRGTISFAPGACRGKRDVRDRPRVMVVSPFLPYPLAHGGAVRMFNLCKALADRVDFALVAIHESRETVHYERLHELFQEIRVVDMDEPVSPDKRLPAQVRRHQSRSLRGAISDLAEGWKPDLLQVEFTHMAGFRDGAPETPAILVEHDLTFSLYRQLAESEGTEEARREYGRWLEFERRWLRDYDAVWTVSEEDRLAAIGEGARPDRTFAIPNGVDILRFRPSETPPAPEILFVGSFRHLPNALAFEQLRSEIMPRVWSVLPNAVARVVAGPDHEWFWRKLAGKRALGADPRIEVHGFVEDLRPLYARAAAVVAPLEVSAGTNIKVLEAMACGKAIVTTPAGCGGLGLRDGHEALIRGDWESFAGALCEILSDASLRARIGQQARLAAERRFSWTAIQDEAYRSYLQVLERKGAARSPRAAVGD